MSPATAAEYSLIRFRKPESEFLFEIPPAEPAGISAMPVAELASPFKIIGMLEGPLPEPADWLPTIERRISNSIAPPQCDFQNEGVWLGLEVAGQAITFFQTASDVLPDSEPYMYASMDGDLVAEFTVPRGKLAAIIGKASVSAFAIADGTVLKKTSFDLPFSNTLKARQELLQLTSELCTAKHGVVET